MPDAPDSAHLAAGLRQSLVRVVRRMRATRGFPLPQAAVLHHLDRLTSTSIGELASHERVRPQSMAQTVGELEALGLVQRSPDPTDGRRVLLTLTAQGTASLEEERRQRDDWLASAIEEQLDDAERAALAIAIPALSRIADT
ncbi:MAG: MarR family transcriptional regulator [Thermoleophilia bacterium]|nr:MarR family transcriptional regulator [Thermoleophilia bacterium]